MTLGINAMKEHQERRRGFIGFCLLKISLLKEFKRKGRTMKKETWKTVIQMVISILTAALTALGTTSCMGHGPF